MASLMKTAFDMLSPSLLGMVSGKLGESEAGVTRALEALVPAILSGMIGHAKTSSGLTGLFGMLSQPANAGFLDDLNGLVGGGNLAHGDPKDAAGHMMGALFGDKVGPILSSVGKLAGLKSHESPGHLLGLAGPLLMGLLGKKIAGAGLGEAGLRSLLMDEADEVYAALPAPLAGVLGLASAHAAATASAAATTAAARPPVANDDDDGGPGWLMWVLPLAALVLLAWFALRGKETTAPAKPETEAAAPAVVTSPAATEPVEVPAITNEAPAANIEVNAEAEAALSDIDFSAIPNGADTRLLDFIKSGKEPCTDPDCWFTMDRLTFNTGSATIDMEKSSGQLTNLQMILAAYPSVQLKFGGYTDNTGSEDVNLGLSQQRADSVVNALVAMGVAPDRMVAEGYGSQFPVADNATEEGRAKNRRIDVRVRQR